MCSIIFRPIPHRERNSGQIFVDAKLFGDGAACKLGGADVKLKGAKLSQAHITLHLCLYLFVITGCAHYHFSFTLSVLFIDNYNY